MSCRNAARVGCVLITIVEAVTAQTNVVSRIVGEASTGGRAFAFLETLTDTIGARVTGSARSRAASQLILTTLQANGYRDARTEEYPLESRWTRGTSSARVLAAVDQPIHVASYGWVPGTPGEIRVPIVDIGAPLTQDLPAPLERLRGAAVLVEPQTIGQDPSIVTRAVFANALARAGAAAMLIPSDKPNRMLYTSAFGFYPRGPLPVVSIASDDARLIRRLLTRGPVQIALDIQNRFDVDSAMERNVIAEIPGTSSADEIVLVGAHFDSWDFAQGANDDGSGVAAVIEAARILKSLDVRPRRTIRFVLFSGEEQGMLGSRAYVVGHEAKLNRHRAVLIMDSGAQKPRGFRLHGRTDVEGSMNEVLEPLRELGAGSLSSEASFDEDHAPFLAAGVPAFTLWVADGDYDTHHHAITDTLDRIDPQLLALSTAVMATAAYLIADAPYLAGERLSTRETAELLNRIGLESTHRMVYEPGRR